MKYFCTYFDRNYAAKGLALIDSLRKSENEQFKIFVVCMDEFTRVLLGRLNLPCVELIPAHALEELDYELLQTKLGRTAVEYLWTTTPTIILRILERNPEIPLLTYVDADLFFYSSCEALHREMGGASVLIHEHRFSPEFKEHAQHGIFNVGLLCFRNDAAGLEVLRWWRERCIEWCHARVEGGKFGDQGYLNDWPVRFPQVRVTLNLGAGVAPWNQSQYKFTRGADGTPCVDGTAIVFYHFHSLTFLNPAVFIPTRDPVYTPARAVGELCFLPYMHALQRAIQLCASVYPQFMFGIIQTNFDLSPRHALLAHASFTEDIAKLSLPQKAVRLSDEWVWYAPGG